MEQYEGFLLIGGCRKGYTYLDDCEAYGADSLKLPPLPLPLDSPIAEMVETTGSLLVAGGHRVGPKSTSDKTFLLQSLSSEAWEELGPMVHAVHTAASVAVGDTIIIIGGFKEGSGDTDMIQILRCNDPNPTWTVSKKKLPKRNQTHNAVLFNDTVVVLTQWGDIYSIPVNSLLNDEDERDWTEEKFPGAADKEYVCCPGMGVWGNSLIVVWGTQVFRKIGMDGMLDEQWTTLKRLPEYKERYPSVGTVRGKLVIAGGTPEHGCDKTATAFMWDQISEEWEEVTPLKQIRGTHATVNLPARYNVAKVSEKEEDTPEKVEMEAVEDTQTHLHVSHPESPQNEKKKKCCIC